MDHDSNFNPVYPFSASPLPLEADCAVPPEVLVTGFSFTQAMSSWVAPQHSRKALWGGERRYSLYYEKPHLAAAARRYSLSAEVHKQVDGTGSGSSTVAIDNKIEQAMDLVKSHLMYAVREEVEVLKEQIKELMERLHKLEQENKVLRSEATPETLSKLPAPLPPIQNPLLQQLMTSLHNPSSSSSST